MPFLPRTGRSTSFLSTFLRPRQPYISPSHHPSAIGSTASVQANCAVMTTVAVAVGRGGKGRGNGSKRAARWAAVNLLPQANRFTLVHVMPVITHIPTPSGARIPVKDLDPHLAAVYRQDIRIEVEGIFSRYKRLCGTAEIETLLLEDDSPATALLKYISDSGVKRLVLGSKSASCFIRKIKGPSVPSSVLKCSPDFCDIFIVFSNKVITRLATSFVPSGEGIQKPRLLSSSLEPTIIRATGGSSPKEISNASSSCSSHSPDNSHLDEKSSIVASTSIKMLGSCNEVKQLQSELEAILSLYNKACEDLIQTQNKVRTLSSEFFEEEGKVNAATVREEALRKIVTEEQAKHLKATQESEAARMLLAKEAYERQIAELRALQESSERRKVVDDLISRNRGYRRYSALEIELATDCFSETKMIGKGSYGKVFKGVLDHIPVAIKVVQQNAPEKREEFLREVEILGRLHHPNIVLLLGACPELGCIIYEYMEEGSLEEHIFCVNNRPPLPWFVRFRIAFEVACGLSFLHGTKPEPIVHRDIKPGNILLGKNFVTKISDVGLAKIISDPVPDGVSHVGNSALVGSLHYIDPEYQRTGTVRPKSDLYSFGIVLLQLLTARSPDGLLVAVEDALLNSSIGHLLDNSIVDWPLDETELLAWVALGCCKLRCRDRPDLETQVIPALKELADVADSSMKIARDNLFAPSHYFCPILKETMKDPYIAADGYSYERKAIEAWLETNDVSPVTKAKLNHFMLTPNRTLQSAIQEWNSRSATS